MYLRRLVSATPVCALIFSTSAAQAQQASGSVTLFQNVRIFDGKSGFLSEPRNVLVRGTRSNAFPEPDRDRSERHHRAHRWRRRTLMPGLIDMHWHTMLVRPTPPASRDVGHRQSRGRRRGHGHADARLHHRSRHGRAGVRAQAGHRRRHRRRPAHLPVRRHHHHHRAATATSASSSCRAPSAARTAGSRSAAP